MDFSWIPSTIRIGMTNLIMVFHRIMGTSEVVASILNNLKEDFEFNKIIDIGSGSGGPMPEAVSILNKKTEDKTKLLLTDLHPIKSEALKFNSNKDDTIRYSENPFDATDFSSAPEGLKTMMDSFHHMPPDKAKKILKSAQENKQPFLIYEIGINNIPTIIWWLLLPLSLSILILMTLFMTPFVKGLSLKQLLFTYIIPVIPICYAWDGQVSIVRIYTFEDIKSLLPESNETYTWKMEVAYKSNGKKLGYYVLGLPK